MPIYIRALALGVAALAGLQASTAVAVEDREGNPVVQPAAAPQQTTPAAEQRSPLGLKPLDAKALATKRGGTKVLNDMNLKGVVADNHLSELMTGNNTISGGSFEGAVGLPMVIQNSGNSVLIQNATIVNVQVK